MFKNVMLKPHALLKKHFVPSSACTYNQIFELRSSLAASCLT